MYNSVLDAHEKSKDLDKIMKDLTKELQALSKEKEAIEKQRTEAIKKHTELELDVKDLQEKISGNFGAKVIFKLCPLQRGVFFFVFSCLVFFFCVSSDMADMNAAFTCLQGDAVRQLQTLQKEIQDSMDELEKMNPLYEDQVMKEKEITKGYVYGILDTRKINIAVRYGSV